MGLRDLFERFINEYRTIFESVWSTGTFTNEFGNLVRHDIAGELRRIAKNVNNVYTSKGSVGQTKWTPVPWIAIFDERITNKATAGEYIVYLLNSETKELYLTFNQASESKNNASVRRILQEKAGYIRGKLKLPESVSTAEINSGNTAYDAGCICSVKYSLDKLPEDKQLIEDLRQFIDIYAAYYEAFYNSDNKSDEWWPSTEEYTPNIDKDRWLQLLAEEKVFNKSSLWVMAAIYDCGGQASCVQLEEKYGNGSDFYRMTSVHLAERIAKTTGCQLPQKEESSKWWPILYVGRATKKGERGNYIWRIREELLDALKEFGITKYLSKEGKKVLSIKEKLAHIKNFIRAKGFSFEDELIENFYLSLKSKPFVILAGISGTGKSKLVKLFAEACDATLDNGQYMLLPVRPDWSDTSDLLGHWTIDNKFKAGLVTKFIDKAAKPENADKPFFLCLDEMNLARVEYYFSDFLSVIETRKMINAGECNKIVTDSLGADLFEGTEYQGLSIPDNLYVIGTVNMDETTFPFSRKVLDRANTIEFSSVNLMPAFDANADINAEDVSNGFLKSEYLMVPKNPELREEIEGFCQKLQDINSILEQCNAQIAYRVRDEALAYYLAHKKEQIFDDDNTAMDYIIIQKLLPRLQGSSGVLKQTLCNLFAECAGRFEGLDDAVTRGDVAEQMKKNLSGDNKYKRSAKKLYDMVRRFEEDGFTSFWA